MKIFNHFFYALVLLVTLSLQPVSAAEPSQKVNINTADAATLAEALNGVGLKKAQAIVAYRKQFGAFKSVDELTEVKGIGEALIQSNRDRVVLK